MPWRWARWEWAGRYAELGGREEFAGCALLGKGFSLSLELGTLVVELLTLFLELLPLGCKSFTD